MNRISKYIEPDINGTVEEKDSLLAKIREVTGRIKQEIDRDPTKEILSKMEGINELL